VLELLLKFCLGVIFLSLSTQAFVKLAKNISLAFRISPLIIGTTIVALGTSLPELSVSLIALVKDDAGLAVGNIIGSNIINILIVLPVGILVGKTRIGKTKTQRNALLILGVTAVFVLLQSRFLPNLVAGLCLFALALIITMLEYQWAVFGRNHEDLASFKNRNDGRLAFRESVSLVFSLVGIVIGGVLLVTSVESLSVVTGYSTTTLGLSLTAIVTSLPELLTTILSQEDNQEKITIGNIIGSNIYNLLFIGGLVTIFSPTITLPIGDWIWLIATTICFVLILRRYSGKVIPKWVGAFLLGLSFIYLLTLKLTA